LISFTVEFVAFGLFTLKRLRVRAQAGPLYIELELTQQGSGENYSVPKKLRGSYEKILRAVCDTEAYKLCRHWTKPGLIFDYLYRETAGFPNTSDGRGD